MLTHVWNQFYEVYNETIHRVAQGCGLQEADLKDCVQDVWLSVYCTLRDYEPRGNRSGLRAWFSKLVRSKVADMVRSKARRPAESLDGAFEPGMDPVSSEADPVLAFEANWDQEMRQAVLAKLMDDLQQEQSPTNRLLLQRRLVESRPVADVAAELGLTVGEVWSRQHRLKVHIRARIAFFKGESFAAMSVTHSSSS